MFGSVTEYFFKFMAGIQSPMEGNTGKAYKHIHFEPHIPQKLQSARGAVETVSGRAASHWKKENGMLKYEVKVPTNTTATIVLPLSEENMKVDESGAKIWGDNSFIAGVKGIHNAAVKDGKLIIETGSGNYNFEVYLP
jgi:alpha-L-rhamnosidase